MRISLTRAASGAAAAAVTALALTGTANAAPIPVKVHTTLSIVESRSVIRAGGKDLVAGTLRAGIRRGLAKEIVYLDRVVGKKLVPVNVGLTNRAGTVAFTVRPKVTARYVLVFRGTGALARSHSGIVTVKVIP